MGIKRNVKRCIWLTLVILMSWVLILEGKAVVDTILAHPDLTVRDYDHLDWSLQKMIVFFRYRSADEGTGFEKTLGEVPLCGICISLFPTGKSKGSGPLSPDNDRFDVRKCEEICKQLMENGLIG